MDRLSSKGQMLSQIDTGSVAHSSFDRRNHNYLSGKLGKLIVTRVDEVYPGDRIKGNVSAVANFEPLVGPILGNMVLKQESFYIPDSIIWKNAHKFFTGKGGFNTPVPRVSPLGVYSAFQNSSLLPRINANTPSEFYQICWDNAAVYSSIINYAVSIFGFYTRSNGSVHDFADLHGVLDIFQPLIDKFEYWFFDEISETYGPTSRFGTIAQLFISADTQDLKIQYYKELVRIICDVCYFIYETFFGVSSHLDYMGFPVIDKWKEYCLGVTSDDENLHGDNYPTLFESFIYGFNADVFIVPDSLFSTIALNWLPFRAAYVCWYWNYRDELLETLALDPESDEFLADDPTDVEIILCTLLRVRCWYKDTFTTALTNTGDGNLSVPIISEDVSYQFIDNMGKVLQQTSDIASAIESGAQVCQITAGGVEYSVPMNYLNPNSLDTVDRGSGSAVSLDLFDRIRRLRSYLQKRFILGYEYDDMVWSSFKVKLSNVRMRIPELLSRGRDEVAINTLVNNTSTEQQLAGDKTAVAWVQGNQSEINYFAEEHGWYISYLTILPVQSYSGGMQRFWMKANQFDYMWPEFANMGMDAVYNYELSAPRTNFSNYGLSDVAATQVFGYQGRYYDLKSRLDETHGRLRTDLNYLTFSREFNTQNLPLLNYMFVHCWPRLDMFVSDDPMLDTIRTIDVYSGLDFERRLPVPSEIL